MAKSFRCQLITPAARVLDDQVHYASIPLWDGLIGVMADRAPIVAKLGVGELRLDFADTDSGKGGSRSFVVDDGFVQMVNNRLTILASRAVPVESLSATDAQVDLTAVEGKTPAASGGEKAAEAERLAREREFARAKVRLARKGAGRAI